LIEFDDEDEKDECDDKHEREVDEDEWVDFNLIISSSFDENFF